MTKCVFFFISKKHGFLGASPDGLVHDPTTREAEGLIEVKFIKNNRK